MSSPPTHPAPLHDAKAARRAVTPENYAFLTEYLRHLTGLALVSDKDYFIEARLLPIARQQNLSTVDDLCALLRATSDSELRAKIVHAVTTNETFFFRDSIPFEAIRQTILPELGRRYGHIRTLRIWSAAASTGQEAYTLAMLLLDQGFGDWNLEILATDISEEVIQKARSGLYGSTEIRRGLPDNFRSRYFREKGKHWEVLPEVRARVTFRQLDLRSNLYGLGPFHLVLCRNVLIYFDQKTRADVLRSIRNTMRPDAYLLLGAAESIFEPDLGFERTMIQNTPFYTITNR